MRPPSRRIRRNLKALDALRVVAIIVGLLILGIIIFWLSNPMLHPREPEPEHTPRGGKSMWEQPSHSPTPAPTPLLRTPQPVQ